MGNQLFRRKSILKVLKDSEGGLTDAGHHPTELKRALSVRDLTAFGIAAVIGTGVFTSIGSASFYGGPGVILLFLFTAVACGFAAFCYAEFASMVPISGSAYTYAYVAFGEIFAWIIGWDLLMEYAIGNIYVAISWSEYFVRVLAGFHINIPAWMTMDYFTARTGYNDAVNAIGKGAKQADVLSDRTLSNCFNAWQTAPHLGPLKIIMNIPALLIVALITYVVYIGIKESRKTNNILVLIKLLVILLVIVAGAFYVKPGNWSHFAPNGLSGIMNGVSAVFFAYIGFDAISTTAEESKNPQRDMPRAMFYTLFICTALYVVLALVLTGMVHYSKLKVEDPLAFVFQYQHTRLADAIDGIVSVSAVLVIASVLLVYQMGQPRIWMSMSRDGLLPKIFSRIHPKYKTPGFSTILTGFVVAVPALFIKPQIVLDLTSIGTLFAFVLVCGGVLVLHKMKERPATAFKAPYINGRYLIPALYVLGWILLFVFNGDGAKSFFDFSSADTFAEKIPLLAFLIISTIITVLSFVKNYSTIPVLGLLSCLYLMTGEGVTNWARFVIWLVIGLVIYFFYGYKNSKIGAPPDLPAGEGLLAQDFAEEKNRTKS